MNKLIGYTEIETSDGKLPLKIGSYTLEHVCDSYGIGLAEIGTLFVTKEIDLNGQKVSYETPKDIIKFLSLVIHHGVNYVAGINGTTQYPLEKAYEWIDEIGLSSQKSIDIIAAFMASIRNGGTPVKIGTDPKTVKKKAANVAAVA